MICHSGHVLRQEINFRVVNCYSQPLSNLAECVSVQGRCDARQQRGVIRNSRKAQPNHNYYRAPLLPPAAANVMSTPQQMFREISGMVAEVFQEAVQWQQFECSWWSGKVVECVWSGAATSCQSFVQKSWWWLGVWERVSGVTELFSQKGVPVWGVIGGFIRLHGGDRIDG